MRRTGWPRLAPLSSAVFLVGLSVACGQAQKVAESVVVVAHGNDPGHFNPAITTSGNVHPITDQIFNGLVGLDENAAPVPELAERWEIEDDGRTYVFHLRQGVRWHDGQPFSADDVVFTFEKVLLEYHSRTRAGLRASLERVEARDPATVVFRFKAPYAPLLQRLDVVEASILPRHIYGAGDILNHPANQTPIGTGPFRFVRYSRGDRVELARNPDYFRPGLPGVDRVVFQIVPSPATAVLALERGEIDYLSSVPGADLPRLRAEAGVDLVQSAGGSGGAYCQEVLIPNLSRPPLNQPAVRRALYHAIDRAVVVDRVYFGQGTASTGPVSRTLAWAYFPDVPDYPHDPARARALLDEAGLRPGQDGVRFRMTFTVPANHARLADLLREQLAGIGVDLALEPLDFNAAVDRVFIRKDFDLGFASFCNGPDPDIGVRRVYDSGNIGPIPFSNGAGYRSDRVDALFVRAAASIDREARRAAYAEMQRAVAGDVPYFWLVDSAGFRAWRNAFTGFRPWAGAFLEAVRPARP